MEKQIDDFNNLKKSIQSLDEFYKLYDESDVNFLNELVNESIIILKDSERVRHLNLMNDEADHLNAFIEIMLEQGVQKVKIGQKCCKECM